ncbi:MAG: hypothetical protein H7222_13490 [Methylotenera sp.]|nr:hypothetical protein [Oligoflexia bacterium]
MGEGIADIHGRTQDPLKWDALLAEKSYCSYSGVMSSPVSAGQSADLEMQIPSGPKRLVQVIGISDPANEVCGQSGSIGSVRSDQAVYYELGRAVADLFSDTTVQISNRYTSLTASEKVTRKINCEQLSLVDLATPADGTYTAGNNLDFTVQFSGPVTASAVTSIDLVIGAATRNALYFAGSGTASLVYRYTVVAGDFDADGIVLASSISLNGGIIKGVDGLTAPVSYTVPVTSGIMVGSAGPVLTSVTPPANLSYKLGSNLDFTANFSANVTAVAVTRIALDIGGVTRYANLFSGSGTSALVYRYTVVAPDTDNDGITLTSPLDLNGGTIQDVSAHNAVLTFNPPNTTAVLVDSTAPTLSGVSIAPGTYTQGQDLVFSVTFSEPVTFNTTGGVPKLPFVLGSTSVNAVYSSATGSTALFRYLVTAVDLDTDGIALNNSILLSGGTIQDGAGNLLSMMTYPAVNTAAVLVIGTPALLSISDGATVDFGPVPLGTLRDKTLTVSQTGTVTATAVTVSGLSSPYSFKGGSYPGIGGTCGASITSSCSLVITYAPTSAGTLSQTLTLGYGNGLGTTNTTRPVQGTGVLPVPTIKLSAGSWHNCAVMIDSTVQCWGQNYLGQLGDGTVVGRISPVKIPSFSGVTQVVSGYSHSCALKSDQTVWCWGGNSSGSLGNGTQVGSSSPGIVTGVSGAVAVAAGDYHTCALLSDNTVKCWGGNSAGQLGIGSIANSLLPVTIAGLGGVIAIAGGAAQTCAVLSTGTVKCWGANANGQIGNGTLSDQWSPVPVSSISNVTSVTVGFNHVCALLTDASIKCWGQNGFGQLGFAPSGNQTVPPASPSLTGVQRVTAGGNHTCAQMTDQSLKCWGYNAYGQIGNGNYAAQSSPTPVAGLSPVTDLSAGGYHSCSVSGGSNVKCWGYNLMGQVGDGTLAYRASPASVSLGLNVSQVAAGESHSCALLSDQTVQCWGFNGSSQLGNGTQTHSFVPSAVLSLGAVLQIAAGQGHTCALLSTSTAKCWGQNGHGQLGLGAASGDVAIPNTMVQSLTNVVKIVTGFSHTCALLADSSVKCWGYNAYGQVGDASTTARASPTLVSSLGLAADITAGDYHTCATLTDGTAKCWGYNVSGQLGDTTLNNSSVPVTVLGLTGATQIVAGQNHTCALVGTTAKCWGQGTSGQLGNAGTSDQHIPVVVSTSGLLSISAGGVHTCAIKSDNTLQCWGGNVSGELGLGNQVPQSSPTNVTLLVGSVTQVSTGGSHTCALAGTSVSCWGKTEYGQLGDGSSSLRILPVSVTMAP